VTVSRVGGDFLVPKFEYEGKVVYGSKTANEGKGCDGGDLVSINSLFISGGPNYSHAVELKSTVQELGELERQVQLAYLKNLAWA